MNCSSKSHLLFIFFRKVIEFELHQPGDKMEKGAAISAALKVAGICIQGKNCVSKVSE